MVEHAIETQKHESPELFSSPFVFRGFVRFGHVGDICSVAVWFVGKQKWWWERMSFNLEKGIIGALLYTIFEERYHPCCSQGERECVRVKVDCNKTLCWCLLVCLRHE